MSDCTCSDFRPPCGQAGQWPVPPTTGMGGSIHHSDNFIVAADAPFGSLLTLARTFDFSASNATTTTVGYFIDCGEYIPCNSTVTPTYSHSVSESCVITQTTPYYVNPSQGIYVVKTVTETLTFAQAGDQTALFKLKFGVQRFHKACLSAATKVQGSEEFFLYKNGIRTSMIRATYRRSPWPDSEGGQSYNGNGDVYQTNVTPDTPNVGLILIWPTVPSQALPLDPDVLHYGFYDYNAIGSGFTASDLGPLDGGKDYFYPYWCRHMPFIPEWRLCADMRWNAQSSFPPLLKFPASIPWTPDPPDTYFLPFGSFMLDSLDNFIYSCLLKFSDGCSISGAIINYASIGDLYTALYTANKLPIQGTNNVFYPVAPL